VGAFIFGLLADRYGRRIPLMANVIYFSIIELLCGFAPNYTVFLILRALFGIGMGGEWGVGASLAMEAAPTRWRGILSGILQSGYSIGYLLAAGGDAFRVARMGLAADVLAGRAAGAAGSLHSDQGAGVGGVAASSRRQHGRSAARGGVELQRFLYLVVLMVFMMFLSHGTQDLYPDFLKEIHKVAPSRVANIAMIYNVGAVIGGGDIWIVVAIAWKAQGDDGGAGALPAGDAVLGVWLERAGADRGDRVHADGRAGSVGA